MIGRAISHYKILEKIGEGGMGVVYLAKDTKLGRNVAMKILTKRLTKKNGARERFKREAKTAASLNHPNIVTVHEIDEHEDLIYIVMEYVEGETLDQKIKIKEEENGIKTAPFEFLKADEIINIVLEICEGLDIAHKAGIIHRDIKLENILINREGRVKILDFGLAKLRGASKLTGDSVALGTVFYMSPEQLEGEEFDHRIDIWSLGILMYVMITGEFPFRGDTAMETISSILNKDPESIIKHNRKVFPGLKKIINLCLKKPPEKRYQDVSALITDLLRVKENLLTGKSDFKLRLTSAIETLRGKIPRVALPAAAGVLAMVLLLSIPSTSIPLRKFFGFNILPKEKRVALLPLEINAGGTIDQQVFSRGLMENLSRNFVRLEKYAKDLLIISTEKLYSNDINSPEAARKKFGVNLALKGSVSWKGDFFSAVLSLIDTKKNYKLYSWKTTKHKSDIIAFRNDLTIKSARVMGIDLKPETRKYLNIGCTDIAGPYEDYLKALGYLLNRKNVNHIENAIRLLTQAVRVDSNYALAYAGLAEAFSRKYDLTNEKKWAAEAVNYYKIAKEKDGRLECIYISVGKVYRKMKRYPEAIQAFRQALKIDPCIFDAYFLLAKIYEEQDNIAEAEKIYQEAARQRPLDYAVQNNLGIFYYRQGRQEDALEPLESVVKLNPNYFAAALNLGALYFSLNRRDDAKRMFKHSLSIETNFAALSNLGTLYFYEGLYDLAIDMFVKALKLDDRNFFIWGYLAESCHWNDPQENERSREYYKKAKTLAKEALLKKPGNNEILSELAFYYMRLNDHGEALAILDKLVAFKDLNQKIMSTIANCYEQMNDREKALKWIKAALGKGFPLAEINNNPGLSELRTAPRFREILKELNNKSIEGKSFKK